MTAKADIILAERACLCGRRHRKRGLGKSWRKKAEKSFVKAVRQIVIKPQYSVLNSQDTDNAKHRIAASEVVFHKTQQPAVHYQV